MYNLYSVKIPEVDELFRKADILNFTAVYRIGNPFKTGATVLDDGGFDFKDQQSIRPFELIQEKDSTILKYKMKDDERVFGLGENLGGLNKRGKTYRLYANDDRTTPLTKKAFIVRIHLLLLTAKINRSVFL